MRGCDHSFQYIRDYYDVPAYVGVRVTYKGREGVIVGSEGPYIKVKLDGDKYAGVYHPTDCITYHPVGAEKVER